MKIKYALLGVALSFFSTHVYSFSCNSPCQSSTPGTYNCGSSSGCLCGICRDTDGNKLPYYYCTDVSEGASGATIIWNYDLKSGTCGSVYQQPSTDYPVCQGTCYMSSAKKENPTRNPPLKK